MKSTQPSLTCIFLDQFLQAGHNFPPPAPLITTNPPPKNHTLLKQMPMNCKLHDFETSHRISRITIMQKRWRLCSLPSYWNQIGKGSEIITGEDATPINRTKCESVLSSKTTKVLFAFYIILPRTDLSTSQVSVNRITLLLTMHAQKSCFINCNVVRVPNASIITIFWFGLSQPAKM